jgi:carbonic anhydrase
MTRPQNEKSTLQGILENQKAWVDACLSEDPEYFHRLAEGQHPHSLFFGCSDSRMCLNSMLGTRPGELFIHRNVGNQVDTTDPNAQAVLEFAIQTLGVGDLIVAGHTRCGGMAAALAGHDQGMVGNWLRGARGLVARNAQELNAIPDPQDRADRLSEINVVAQTENVLRSHPYRRAREAGNAPEVHGWLFGLETGYIREVELPLDRWRREKFL